VQVVASVWTWKNAHLLSVLHVSSSTAGSADPAIPLIFSAPVQMSALMGLVTHGNACSVVLAQIASAGLRRMEGATT
jgi:hypothetical protein